MTKTKDKGKDNFDFNINWYEIWMKQSKEFFESANANFREGFAKGQFNPEENMKQINAWMEALKNQWQFMQLNEQQKAYEEYWKAMTKMCSDATDVMLKEWVKRSREQHPINDVRELYDIWLNSCNQIYSQAMRSKNFQQVYGEFLDAALKFWKSSTPK